MQLPQSLNQALADSIRSNWTKNSMSDYGEFTFQYKDVARIIEKLHIMFEAAGIKKGDKIALCGRNQSRWGVAFFATLTYGAVAVPILHEFHPEQVIQILDHSESKLLFVGQQVWKKINTEKMPEGLVGVLSNEDYNVLFTRNPVLSVLTLNRLDVDLNNIYPDPL